MKLFQYDKKIWDNGEVSHTKERQDALMFWSKAAFYAGYECSLCDKLEEKIKHEEND